jgi:hypothetical protein
MSVPTNEEWVVLGKGGEPPENVKVTVLVSKCDTDISYTARYVRRTANAAEWVLEDKEYEGWNVRLWTKLRKPGEPRPPLPKAW